MPVVNCPIDIPEGWEFVRYGTPISGETFLNEDGEPESSDSGHVYPWVIIRRARPAIEVGDWVTASKVGSTFYGVRGVIQKSRTDGDYLVQFGSRGAGWFCGDELIKQARTIEPYTIDQLISEAAKRGRHVQCGGKSTIIESIHIAGVTLSCPSIGFVSYVDATSQLTWSGGEAFGTVTWRDAE